MTPVQILAMSALGMAPALLAPMLRLQGITRPPFNLIISNVPGPAEAALLQRRRGSTGVYPLSIPIHGQALNITCTSYAGQHGLRAHRLPAHRAAPAAAARPPRRRAAPPWRRRRGSPSPGAGRRRRAPRGGGARHCPPRGGRAGRAGDSVSRRGSGRSGGAGHHVARWAPGAMDAISAASRCSSTATESLTSRSTWDRRRSRASKGQRLPRTPPCGRARSRRCSRG